MANFLRRWHDWLDRLHNVGQAIAHQYNLSCFPCCVCTGQFLYQLGRVRGVIDHPYRTMRADFDCSFWIAAALPSGRTPARISAGLIPHCSAIALAASSLSVRSITRKPRKAQLLYRRFSIRSKVSVTAINRQDAVHCHINYRFPSSARVLAFSCSLSLIKLGAGNQSQLPSNAALPPEQILRPGSV